MSAAHGRTRWVTTQQMVGGVAAIAAAILLVTGAGAEAPTPPFKDKLTGEALRGGGHVIYVRHGSTEKDYAD
jgi:hypothetical protein